MGNENSFVARTNHLVWFQAFMRVVQVWCKGLSDKNIICDDWRLAAGLYKIVKHELGGIDAMHLFTRLMFTNPNTFEIIKFCAKAPEFLSMIRSSKREFFLDAYNTGNTHVILGAVNILDPLVADMIPPRG